MSSSESSSEDELCKEIAKKREETPPKKEKKSKKRPSEAVEEKPAKKAKDEKAEVSGRLKDEHGNEMFEFGNLRYATVSNFKGKEYVNIREYYVDKNSGKMMPGRKGISLTKAQWANLKDVMPEIDKKL